MFVATMLFFNNEISETDFRFRSQFRNLSLTSFVGIVSLSDRRPLCGPLINVSRCSLHRNVVQLRIKGIYSYFDKLTRVVYQPVNATCKYHSLVVITWHVALMWKFHFLRMPSRSAKCTGATYQVSKRLDFSDLL